LDSGEGEKLERFGRSIMARPDPQALWAKRLPADEWKKADAYFGKETESKEKGERGDWNIKNKEMPEKWEISFAGLKFWIKPTAFKHVGLFPEQSVNWSWLKEIIVGALGAAASSSPAELASRNGTALQSLGRSRIAPVDPVISARSNSPRLVGSSAPVAPEIEVLNLFGYTGGATLACAQAGAKVVHIDGSKSAMAWARENAELSGLADKPVRWIIEDARVFVEREIRRDRRYDGIIMDPPAFGHGPDGGLWKIEEDFLPLIEDCKKLLKPKPLFFLVNGYSAGYSPIAYENNLLSLKEKFGGTIEIGELTIEESHGSNGGNEPQSRLLPCGIFARWAGNGFGPKKH
jgi:23S rRNA (cytosine1962-C5)-methyltransferase